MKQSEAARTGYGGEQTTPDPRATVLLVPGIPAANVYAPPGVRSVQEAFTPAAAASPLITLGQPDAPLALLPPGQARAVPALRRFHARRPDSEKNSP